MQEMRRAAEVEELFPPGAVAFANDGCASPDGLFVEDQRCIEHAATERAREFAAGRLCAYAALSALGVEPTAIPMGFDRKPVWPDGIVGSISHTSGCCTAVLGKRTQFAAIGFDVERVDQVPRSVWNLVLRPEELAAVEVLAESECRRVVASVFSAKEAFFKCQYELTHRWVGFEDVAIQLMGNVFEVVPTRKAAVRDLLERPWRGRLSIDATFVRTGICRLI